MYKVIKNGSESWEADACGIGFLASRNGVAERYVVEKGLELASQFDHRGAPGHGSGVQIDIPWPLVLERFSLHSKAIAQRDVALGMFFLPYEGELRRKCIEHIEALAELAHVKTLQWADVPIHSSALPANSAALRTLPVVRQALFLRPQGLSEQGWFTCRYLLRLAIDHKISKLAGDEFAVASLSNRTIVYKGLSELSKISELYPDLQDPQVASRYILFHSRYCTNTTTAWRRAQPFWAIAHNGEISTIEGNRAWMTATGADLLSTLSERFPSLRSIAAETGPIVCDGGSDTANLDDMIIALIAGGMSLPQAILALLPESRQTLPADSPLEQFYEAGSVYFGACDGPAAIVACDGDQAVAHLDRNGLRPLWVCTSDHYVLAASELTGVTDLGEVHEQKMLGPGESILVKLNNGDLLWHEDVHDEVSRIKFPLPHDRIIGGDDLPLSAIKPTEELSRLQTAFGMTKEDLEVLLAPQFEIGKPAIGSMGDDTPMAAMLDELPRRLEDHFALRFAQETSPPIDPIRDEWVFDSKTALGDRRGPWKAGTGPIYKFSSPILSNGEMEWLKNRQGVEVIDLTFLAKEGYNGHEEKLNLLVNECLKSKASVLVLSDRLVSQERASVLPLRAISLVHRALGAVQRRNMVSIVGDVGIWDIHHAAQLCTLGADAVCPWLGLATAWSELNGEDAVPRSSGVDSGSSSSTQVAVLENEVLPETSKTVRKVRNYLSAMRSGLVEVMSMMGVTPSTAYCGASLIEAIGLDSEWVRAEFGVSSHISGIGKERIVSEWLSFHRAGYGASDSVELVDVGEFRHSKNGRPHANNAEVVRALHAASGYTKKIHGEEPGTYEAYKIYSDLVSSRKPITLLDCLQIVEGTPVPLDQVEPVESIAWRFMAPGMSEGALSEPAHRAVARGLNVLARYCRIASLVNNSELPKGIGPIANSGEGGFEKSRVGTADFNRSVQYAGGRFTITPMTAASADEAEVKFAQGAKPGKGGQLPGKKVSEKVARQRGCEPGYELVSPPINHNLYSIEDVKLMLESWRTLNPSVNCALKYVATTGVEMVALGGVNAGANRIHISDGCGGTGAAKRVDQKHAGVPLAAVLPKVQDSLIEEGMRHLVELSVDGGVQNGEHALKLFLLGADRVGFGTSLLISIGCSMLRKCHLSGPDPADPSGKRRLGCTPGIATQDPVWISRFAGNWKHVTRTLLFAAQDVRERMAKAGITNLQDVIGERDLLERRQDLTGKAALLDLTSIVRAPNLMVKYRDYASQSQLHMTAIRSDEEGAAHDAFQGKDVYLASRLTNESRCVGVASAGIIARKCGDAGLKSGKIRFHHEGAAGHFYAAYSLSGMKFKMRGVVADSCFTAAYGGEIVIVSEKNESGLGVVGNAFGYGARDGKAFIAGLAGNRFGICLRKSHEGSGPALVVEGVAANAFQYMTGGTALVLGPVGFNLGSGMTGGTVFILDLDTRMLNPNYVLAAPLGLSDIDIVETMMREHFAATESKIACKLLKEQDWTRFSKVVTKVKPEPVS